MTRVAWLFFSARFGGGEWGKTETDTGRRLCGFGGRRNNKIRLHGPKGGSFFFRRSTSTLVCGGEKEETEQKEERGREEKRRGEWDGWHSESRSVGRDGGLDFFSGEMGPDSSFFLVYL